MSCTVISWPWCINKSTTGKMADRWCGNSHFTYWIFQICLLWWINRLLDMCTWWLVVRRFIMAIFYNVKWPTFHTIAYWYMSSCSTSVIRTNAICSCITCKAVSRYLHLISDNLQMYPHVLMSVPQAHVPICLIHHVPCLRLHIKVWIFSNGWFLLYIYFMCTLKNYVYWSTKQARSRYNLTSFLPKCLW